MGHILKPGIWLLPRSCKPPLFLARQRGPTGVFLAAMGALLRLVRLRPFMALFLQLLRPGGRAAVIVPDGVLFGSSKAHKELRRSLVEDHFLEGVVSLPSDVFHPYAGVSTAILLFTKTGRGGTDQVWSTT